MKFIILALVIIFAVLSLVHSTGNSIKFKKLDQSQVKQTKASRKSSAKKPTLRSVSPAASNNKLKLKDEFKFPTPPTTTKPELSLNRTQVYSNYKSNPVVSSPGGPDFVNNKIDHVAGANPMFDYFARLGSYGDGENARYASFGPASCMDQVALAPESEDFYVADSCENRVRKISRRTNTIHTVAGGGSGDEDGDEATEMQLNSVNGLTVSKKYFYFSTYKYDSGAVIYKIKISSGKVKMIAGGGEKEVYENPMGEHATEYYFDYIDTLTVGPDGVVYFPTYDGDMEAIYFIKDKKLQFLTNDYPDWIHTITVAPGSTRSGDIYFTMPEANAVGYADIDSNRVETFIPFQDYYFYPTAISTAPNGDIYFTENDMGGIWRMYFTTDYNVDSAAMVYYNSVSYNNGWTKSINVDSNNNLLIGASIWDHFVLYKVKAPYFFYWD